MNKERLDRAIEYFKEEIAALREILKLEDKEYCSMTTAYEKRLEAFETAIAACELVRRKCKK